MMKSRRMYPVKLGCPKLGLSRGAHTRTRGLTMIELLVVVAIFGILLSIGIPSFTRFIADWRLSNAVNAFQGSLRVARAEAIARRRVVQMCATNGGNACVGNADYAQGWMVFFTDANNAVQPLVTQAALPGLNTINAGANINMQFLPTGIMRAGQGANFSFQTNHYVDAASTAWARKRIAISRTGRVRKL